jgi:probable HAF family extracellular repeat protein
MVKHMLKNVASALLLAISSPMLLAAPLYGVTTFGISGPYSTARGLNDAGQVIGTYMPTGYSPGAYGMSATHGFVTSASSYQDIGTLGGAHSTPFSINSKGQVVGHSTIAGDQTQHAFLYADNVLSDINPNGAQFSSASGINEAGDIAAIVNNQSYLISPTGLATQIVGGYLSGTTAINEQDSLAGYIFSSSMQAFLSINGKMTLLGTLGGQDSSATAMNDANQVVGYSKVASNTASHAFLYSDGVMIDLGTLGGQNSTAVAINALGQVVGTADSRTESLRPFLYANGVMTDLNSLIDAASGWTIRDVGGINSLQQIAATACNQFGCQAVRLDLLAPVNVPEPATYAMMLLGLALMTARRKRSVG